MGLMAGTSAKWASSGIVMAVFRSASMLKTTVAEMASSGYLELTSWASSWAVSPASFLYLRSKLPGRRSFNGGWFAGHAAFLHPSECLSVDFGLVMVVPGHALRLRNGWSPRRL